MKMYELNWLLPNLYYSNKQQLECTRFISYIIAQSQSTKPLKLTDIMSFEWDKKQVQPSKTSNQPSKKDIERLRQKALKRQEQNNKK